MGKTLLHRPFFAQLLKYSVVGASNTVLTAGVIWIVQEILIWSPSIANALGYLAGLINGFIWNSRWTFSSRMSVKRLVSFVSIFGFCYVIQFFAFHSFNAWEAWCDLIRLVTPKYIFVNQLASMGVFTTFNFLLNKFITYSHYMK